METKQIIVQLLVAQNDKFTKAFGLDWISNAKSGEFDCRTTASAILLDALKPYDSVTSESSRISLAQGMSAALGFIMGSAIAETVTSQEQLDAGMYDTLAQRAYDRWVQSEKNSLVELSVPAVRRLFRSLQSAVNTGNVGEMWYTFFTTMRNLDITQEEMFSMVQGTYVMPQVAEPVVQVQETTTPAPEVTTTTAAPEIATTTAAPDTSLTEDTGGQQQQQEVIDTANQDASSESFSAEVQQTTEPPATTTAPPPRIQRRR